ncbi:hypothetical protein M431DRAFT_372395 [Trichoderma harzianum CBS 226.95]|uniref:Uncharacterized protein n=1 Tax=Trichoderma harzianum CBS 226.95 TaxID=983964 RepID=A0A2T4AGS9_TRIHA|nr:hypothetical protein M431DRAFT_372395 [Trichoderma harzianum CBS 226.95]PTB56295.1 hypothetical protein M431DRAFT_372395 [Trichoderma harzianum CBS 226.95]
MLCKIQITRGPALVDLFQSPSVDTSKMHRTRSGYDVASIHRDYLYTPWIPRSRLLRSHRNPLFELTAGGSHNLHMKSFSYEAISGTKYQRQWQTTPTSLPLKREKPRARSPGPGHQSQVTRVQFCWQVLPNNTCGTVILCHPFPRAEATGLDYASGPPQLCD